MLRNGHVVDGDRCTPLVLLKPVEGEVHRQPVVWRPAEGCGAVHSVTVALIESHLMQAGFTMQEGPPLTVEALHDADEVIVVGSGVGVQQLRAVDGKIVGNGKTRLLQAARSALQQARRGGWYTVTAVAQCLKHLPAEDGWKHWPAPTGEWLMPSIAQVLLEHRLWGDSAIERGWAPDRLLLHSGGPPSDMATFSMLAGPPTLRFRARQPRPSPHTDRSMCKTSGRSNTGADTKRRRLGTAAEGRIPLLGENGAMRPELCWACEEWSTEQWQPLEPTVSALSLSSALRNVAVAARQAHPSRMPQGTTDSSHLPIRGSSIAGLMGYDLVQWTEPLNLDCVANPDELIGVLYRVDRWLLHDRSRGTVSLWALPGDPWGTHVARVVDGCLPALRPLDLKPINPTPLQHGCKAPGSNCGSAISSMDDESHKKVVNSVQDLIRSGHLYQLNFGRQWTGRLREHPWDLMLRLFTVNASPYSAFLMVPDEGLALCSSSPELLLSTVGGMATTCPIKGTCKRGRDTAEDAKFREEMVADKKELAEHLMLVDLERHDLGRVCKAGSVAWESWRVESFPRVQHMTSRVIGRLRADADSWEALAAVFPGGSITGCPKTVTIAAIDELEPIPRQMWTGSMGYCDLQSGDSQWSILIRTLVAHKAKPDEDNAAKGAATPTHEHSRNCCDCWTAEVKAGGGLTIGSVPQAEVDEAKAKAEKLLHTAFGACTETVSVSTGCNHVEDLGQYEIKPSNPHAAALLSAFSEAANGKARCCPQDCCTAWRCWSHGDPPLAPITAGDVIGESVGSPRVLFIDNLDSFSLNIVNACAILGAEVVIVNGRGPQAPSAAEAFDGVRPTHIIIGPGPGRPEMSPLTMELAQCALAGSLGIPLLGICLGHQALCLAAGCRLVASPRGPVHGVPEDIHHDGQQLFGGLPSPVRMVRYNSLVVLEAEAKTEEETIDQQGRLTACAWDESRTLVMAVRHTRLPVCGVQFHPESAGSCSGSALFNAFLRTAPSSNLDKAFFHDGQQILQHR